MLTYAICALLLVLAAGCKGVQDSIAHHNSQKWRGIWWDTTLSWRWKYVDQSASGLQSLKPRFFGSTTFLVWTTDAWHCFGMLNMSAWQTALCLLLPYPWYGQLAAFVGIKVFYGLFFEVTYRHLNKQTP